MSESTKKIDFGWVNGNPYFNVHADTGEELDELIKAVLPRFKAFKNAVDVYRERKANEVAPPPGGQTNPPVCGVHGTTMSWKTGNYKNNTQYHKIGDPYGFWSCPTKNADGSYCKYKPE